MEFSRVLLLEAGGSGAGGVLGQKLMATFSIGEREVRMIQMEMDGEPPQFILEGNIEEEDRLTFMEMWMDRDTVGAEMEVMLAQFAGIVDHFFGY